MNMKEIHAKAKELGVNSFGKKKAEIIRAIQTREGNTPCFQAEGSTNCDQMQCCWRKDCLAA